MIERIRSDLYKVEIPLSMSELGYVNSYVIKGSQRNLIIDTGMDTKGCMDAMKDALEELHINLQNTDFFITHYHGDHFGLLHRLMSSDCSIYMSEIDAGTVAKIGTGAIMAEIVNFIHMSGIPEDDTKSMVPPDATRPFKADYSSVSRFLKDNDFLEAGDYRFRCVAVPGHSKGHICLYEPEHRILFSGDHILGDITPGIQARSEAENPLDDYLASLDKIHELDVDLVLPGHRTAFRNCRGRIEEIKIHHRNRVAEIVSILREGTKNTYQVASLMSWNTVCDSWEDFPVLQRFFAAGEAFAHLRHLEERGIVKNEMRGEEILFFLAA